MTKPLALTLGEPAGIGPDIALEAWLRRRELDLPPFYLLGDRAFLAERAKILRLKVELADTVPQDAGAAFANALPVVATGDMVRVGDLLGEIPEGSLGARVHAGIAGRVTLENDAVVIERSPV